MYVVIGIQTNADNTVGILTSSHNTFPEAQNKYYTVLAYAAISEIPVHAAVLCDNSGTVLMSQGFEHLPEEAEESI